MRVPQARSPREETIGVELTVASNNFNSKVLRPNSEYNSVLRFITSSYQIRELMWKIARKRFIADSQRRFVTAMEMWLDLRSSIKTDKIFNFSVDFWRMSRYIAEPQNQTWQQYSLSRIILIILQHRFWWEENCLARHKSRVSHWFDIKVAIE